MKNEMFKNYADIVGVKELMEMLNIGKTFAYELLKSKELGARKCGREYKIPKINIIKYILGGENGDR